MEKLWGRKFPSYTSQVGLIFNYHNQKKAVIRHNLRITNGSLNPLLVAASYNSIIVLLHISPFLSSDV